MALTPAQIKADYLDAMDRGAATVIIRRFSGPSASRTHVDTTARARVVGGQSSKLNGDVVQNERKIIVLAADLIAAGFSLPITVNDKVVDRGKEFAIIDPDDSTRRYVDLIGIDLVVRGA